MGELSRRRRARELPAATPATGSPDPAAVNAALDVGAAPGAPAAAVPEAAPKRKRDHKAEYQAKRARQLAGARTLTAADVAAAGISSSRSAPATAPVQNGPAPGAQLTPEQRAAAVSSVAGVLRVLGVVLAAFLGAHWRVADLEAQQTAELCVEAWPELAHQTGDVPKLLAIGTLGSLLIERVEKTRELRARASSNGKPAGDPIAVVAEPAAPRSAGDMESRDTIGPELERAGVAIDRPRGWSRN